MHASWHLFDVGAIRKNIQVRASQQKQALIAYEAAVLGAMEEIENALTAYVNEQGRRDSLARAVQEAEQAVQLAEKKYKAGLVDFTTVLDSRRTLLSSTNQLAGSEGNMAANLVRLYKVLGGGWLAMLPGWCMTSCAILVTTAPIFALKKDLTLDDVLIEHESIM